MMGDVSDLTRRRLLTGAAGVAVGAAVGRVGPVESAPKIAAPCPANIGAAATSVVYSSDLNHPNGDLDDHVDLAVMHALDVDVRLVVLDRHVTIAGDGMVPFNQLAAITGAVMPVAQGLPDKLPSLQRAGATAILDCLRASSEPVTVVAVGSLRDVAATINTDRALCIDKIGRVVVFAGDPTHGAAVEYNVLLDPLAFLTVMTSGLSIRWVPCFDGGTWRAGTRSSFVQANQRDVFPLDLNPRLLRFFTYRLRSATSDPIAWLNVPLDATDRNMLTTGHRNLWCAGLLGAAIGDGVMRWQGAPVGVFEPVTARWNLLGMADAAGAFEATVDLWRVTDPVKWPAAMVAETVTALRRI